MIKTLKTLHGEYTCPIFLPDATRAVVKGGLDSTDLDKVGIEGLVVNTLHLSEFGLGKAHKTQSVHSLMNWDKLIITDSGGFQIMSLIHQNPKAGKLTDNEAIFYAENKQKIVFRPEDSIRLQLQLGADILICLDDCTKPDDLLEKQEKSVARTINWALRCKKEFTKQITNLNNKPMLFAVIQGGQNKSLRKKCAKSLIKIGFDGYCFGGFPLNQEGQFLSEIIKFTAALLPDDKPKYAMGIGTPQNIMNCFNWGYNIFDCVIPTREARHKRLYIFKKDPNNLNFNDKNFYSTISLQQSRFADNQNPPCEFCDCLTCRNYTLSYLYHLFKIKDLLAFRLATIHNLRFYSKLMGILKTINNSESSLPPDRLREQQNKVIKMLE